MTEARHVINEANEIQRADGETFHQQLICFIYRRL